MDVYELLETAPEHLEPIASLISWSANYDWRTGTPYGVFLDLIGYSKDEFGQQLVEDPSQVLGYLEIGYLADALTAYSNRPHDVLEFIQNILTAETEN